MDDSRETQITRAFVCGHPIKHSRSPIIHRYWLSDLKIAGEYEPVDIAPEKVGRFIADLRSRESGYVGGNVTIPHKQAVFELVDRPDELAEELGAINTVYKEGGLVLATNTDGYGFLSNLDERAPDWDKMKDRAVILGAGGASRAVIQAIRDRGFKEIHVLNRTTARAGELADRFGPRIHAAPLGAISERLNGADLFVNTTSLGMDGEAAIDIDFSPMAPDGLVTDIVYVPLLTPFLAAAKNQGKKIADGLGMLLHQAVPGFEKWFGARPQVTLELRARIVLDLDRHR